MGSVKVNGNEYILFGGKHVAALPGGGNAQYYIEDLLAIPRLTKLLVLVHRLALDRQ